MWHRDNSVDQRHRLFVYGSLRRGGRHHDRMREAEFESIGATSPGYELLRYGDYPGLVPAEGAGVVRGEVYRVSEMLLKHLDEFEACPDLYRREWVTLEDGSQAMAYLLSTKR
jgi:gamma-glutamylcyclotransferase (GGCT)/AIG2-like uncharacterized protein YtfP